MLHSTEKMDVDLSIVKQEGLVDDYGQNNGNILDNFIAEHDYHDFPQSVPSVSSMDEEGVNVDWLSSFFDEPGLHSHMSSGLNPPLSDLISSAAPTTKSNDTLTSGASSFLDAFPTYSDDYRNLCESNSLKSPLSPTSPTLRSCNPLLCQPTENIKSHEIKQEVVYDIVAETKSEAQTVTVQSPTASQTKQQVPKLNDNSKPMLNKTEKQQKLLLFMNTPENRAKLAGTNFNIVNANLLSKITGQNSNTEPYKKPMNVIQLKKCIQLNNTLKQSISTANDSNKTINCSPKIIVNTQNGITDILQSSLGIIKKETTESIEVDSGYESPNSTESPGSPPLDIEKAAYDSYIDVPPQDRHPFYLSEEEKRTLIIEGLPVPATLPLNKMEERALKKVRRKIKNKISAQESRRKKKEYMEALEKRVDTYANENNVLKKKMSNLEVANRSLILQVQKLQAMLNNNKQIHTNNQDVLVT